VVAEKILLRVTRPEAKKSLAAGVAIVGLEAKFGLNRDRQITAFDTSIIRRGSCVM
jgi:hypothetical protein